MRLATTNVLWAAALAAMVSCENNPQELTDLTKKVTEVEEGHDIVSVFSQSGNLKAYLTAPLMKRVKADTLYVEFPNSLHVDFYNEYRQLQNVVTARYARYFESLGKVLLKDSVVVYNMIGDTLHCNTLWWDQGQEIFYTSDSVAVRTLTQTINGTAFWAKSDFSKWTINNTVGSILMPGEKVDSVSVAGDTAATRKLAAPGRPAGQ
ncbi:MAG: LPS export ABC transporter periplasmic protein LptC [Chitinophagaceae bacterium]|jgi:LPS export ABC transporter protein LptC|nr:LPS export ABC transporter periplasmic protein LptC [Chitinophagaceae bacterium]